MKASSHLRRERKAMMLLPWKRATRETSTGPSVFEDLASPLLAAFQRRPLAYAQRVNDAADLVQETFLKSLRGFAGFEPGIKLSWIFRVLRNTYLISRSGLAARQTVVLEDELDERSESGAELYPRALSIWLTRIPALIRFISRAFAGSTGCERRYGR